MTQGKLTEIEMTKNVTKFASIRQQAEQKVAAKVTMMTKARSLLEEAKKTFSEGETKSGEGESKAYQGAFQLYALSVAGSVSKEEVSQLLGEVFGFKAKTNGSGISKTPEKAGEAIRKRIVRATEARLYADGKTNDPPAWAGKASREDVASVMNAVDEGKKALNYAYNELGELKGKTEGVQLFANINQIQKLINQLTDKAAAGVIAKSPPLLNAYANLQAAIAMMDAEVTKIDPEVPLDAIEEKMVA
jgi:hypothetical protein